MSCAASQCRVLSPPLLYLSCEVQAAVPRSYVPGSVCLGVCVGAAHSAQGLRGTLGVLSPAILRLPSLRHVLGIHTALQWDSLFLQGVLGCGAWWFQLPLNRRLVLHLSENPVVPLALELGQPVQLLSSLPHTQNPLFTKNF